MMNRVKIETHIAMPRAVFLDKRVSLAAKGLYALIMSLPGDDDLTVKEVANVLDESEKEIEPYLNELLDHGYIRKADDEEGD